MIPCRRILVVDDESNVRRMFRTALESSRYEVAEARDGAISLADLRDTATDLVLLDLFIPLLNGMETLVRLSEAGHDVPTVIATAPGRILDVVQAMKLGAIDFLVKPVTPDALREVVAELVQRQVLARPSDKPGPAPVTAVANFAENLSQAKRTLNAQRFDEAEVFSSRRSVCGPARPRSTT